MGKYGEKSTSTPWTVLFHRWTFCFCSSIATIFFPLKIAYSSSSYYLSSFVWLFSLELMIIFFPWFVFVFRSYFSFHRHSGPFLFGWSAMIIWNFALILCSLSLFICSIFFVFSPTKNKMYSTFLHFPCKFVSFRPFVYWTWWYCGVVLWTSKSINPKYNLRISSVAVLITSLNSEQIDFGKNKKNALKILIGILEWQHILSGKMILLLWQFVSTTFWYN